MWSTAGFWPLFKAVGMLEPAEVGLDGGLKRKCVDVGFSEPDAYLLDGTQSKQYLIEYQTHDLPTLAEGDEVLIRATLFRVRQAPYVAETGSNNGFYRHALLTRV